MCMHFDMHAHAQGHSSLHLLSSTLYLAWAVMEGSLTSSLSPEAADERRRLEEARVWLEGIPRQPHWPMVSVRTFTSKNPV